MPFGPDYMTDFNNYYQTVGELLKKTPSFQNVGAAGYHPGLETMMDFDDFLGNPHRLFSSIHIAGTNGKGSVAHFMAATLAASGYRTGLYTSPHLVDFRERIKIVEPEDDTITCRMIPEDDVLSFLSYATPFISGRNPSFFEITTAMAFDWFKKQNVHFAVVECGLGGRLDSTNIITPALSIITAIGFDHKDILGDTIEKIAREKAGIIKRHIPAVLGKMPETALSVMHDVADKISAEVFYAPDFSKCPSTGVADAVLSVDTSELDLSCPVQHQNLQIVAKSLDVLIESRVIRDDESMAHSVSEVLKHTGRLTGLRGRWETLCEHPRIICDIGHNENALTPVMKQLRSVVEELRPKHFYMIFGMAGDKDIASVIHLLPQNARYIFTNARGSRAMRASQLEDLVTSGWTGEREDLITDSVEEAVSKFYEMADPDDLLYIGGSSYVVAEAIPLVEKRNKTRPSM